MELKIEDYNGIIVNSENFTARFIADFYELKNPAEEVRKLKEVFDNSVENTNNLSEIEQFEETVKNITEKCPATINDITFIISDKMLEEKPIYEYFNKYSDIFFDKVEQNIMVENEYNLKEKPHMYIEKGHKKYDINYENEHGRCHVTAFNSGYSVYSIHGKISIPEIKNFTDMTKNTDMDKEYDNSGKPKNYEVNLSTENNMVITVAKNDNHFQYYETSINILSRNELEQTRCYIKTQVPADNEKLFENILEISDGIRNCRETEHIISEFSAKLLKELSEIKKDITKIPDNVEIQTDFQGEPHKIFSKILSENMDSDCNINVTQNCTDTKYSYSSTGQLFITIEENIDTKISIDTDNINKNVNISYYGDMSDSFKKECIRNLEEISGNVPELSKLNDYVIENINKNNVTKEDLDI